MRRGAFAIALLVVVVIAAHGNARGGQPLNRRAPPSGPLPAVARLAHIERLQVGGTPAVIAIPAQRTRDAIVWIHGAGANQWAATGVPLSESVTTTLLRHGYTIAASDADGNNWGNARSQQAQLALVQRLKADGFTRLFVIAQSMGGLDALHLIDQTHLSAWVGIYPVCNLRTMNYGVFAPSIRRAYGSAESRAFAQDSPLIPAHVSGLRMLFFASPQDTTVLKSTNTDLCAARLRSEGADVKVVTTTGPHGARSDYRPAELLRFFG